MNDIDDKSYERKINAGWAIALLLSISAFIIPGPTIFSSIWTIISACLVVCIGIYMISTSSISKGFGILGISLVVGYTTGIAAAIQIISVFVFFLFFIMLISGVFEIKETFSHFKKRNIDNGSE